MTRILSPLSKRFLINVESLRCVFVKTSVSHFNVPAISKWYNTEYDRNFIGRYHSLGSSDCSPQARSSALYRLGLVSEILNGLKVIEKKSLLQSSER